MFTFLELEQEMTFLSAQDDFVHKTLDHVPGSWGKLRYLAQLRDKTGDYAHWGMARTYGEATARQAIGDAHRKLMLQLLRTPVEELLQDAASSAQTSHQPLVEFLQDLAGMPEALLPANMGGGSAVHFSSVLQALGCLARAGKGANLLTS